MRIVSIILTLGFALAGCAPAEEEVEFFTKAAVVEQDIIVSVEAAGVIEPILTVELKSKASGEILSINTETGDIVEEGALLVQIDERTPKNNLAQADAALEAAIARQGIAIAQANRGETLFKSKSIPEQDYEQLILERANAQADVVRTQVNVENLRIALEDTVVSAPLAGTIIEKLVEKGQVISSPTQDVGGGTTLLRMADLSVVQVKALVDETDIGKIVADQPVTVTVTAYPNQPFTGHVKKIEPQAEADQTVTTFSVLVLLDNERRLLRPGMNADVEIRVSERYGVLAVPTMALRTLGDIPVSAQLVGVTVEQVRSQLGLPAGGGQPRGAAGWPGAGRQGAGQQGAGRPGAGAPRPRGPRAAGGRQRPGSSEGGVSGYQFSNRYWVFRVRADGSYEAVNVPTGVTDLEYNEVLDGLAVGDEVLLLPSSGLVMDQQRLQQRMARFSTLPGMGSSK
jgi:HlyD family secretion protein